MAERCPACGAEAAADSEICLGCGRSFGDSDRWAGRRMPGPDEAQASPPAPPEPAALAGPHGGGAGPARSPALFIVGGFVLLMAVLLLPRRRPAPPPEPGPALPAAPAPSPAPAARPAPRVLHALPDKDPRDGVRRRTLSGTVFLLGSLAPARGARLIFRDAADGTLHAARADGRGRFRALLEPRLAGYYLEIEHGGAPLRYLEDWVPSLRTLAAGKRAELARDLLSRPQDEELIVLAVPALTRDYAVEPAQEAQDDAR